MCGHMNESVKILPTSKKIYAQRFSFCGVFVITRFFRLASCLPHHKSSLFRLSMQDEAAMDRSRQYTQSSPEFVHRDESKVSRPAQRRSVLSRTPTDFYQIMLEKGISPPTTFAVVQELVGVVAEYCTPKECVDTLQLVSRTWRRAVLDLPCIREAYVNGVSRRDEIEGETAPMRSYAKLNASIMLIVWLCIYPWVFLVWAGMPTVATKHNFDGVLACFIVAVVGCLLGFVGALVLTIMWLIRRAPSYTKSRCVQGAAHITRCIVLTACTVAGIVCLTRYQTAWGTTATPSHRLPSARALLTHRGQRT